jgi:uncharacterized protein YjdB
MTFKHKLAKRLALSWRAALGLAPVALLSACAATSPTLTDAPQQVLSVSPDQINTDYQQTVQFTAFLRDQAGDSTPTTVQWRATSGTITDQGVFTADTVPGEATVSVVDTSGRAASATVDVGYSGQVSASRKTARPGKVSDLSVAAVASDSVTLRFTEVDDGAGQPAQYQIRYAVGSISWGSATPVAQGTCASPMAGTAIGATRECSVTGLSAATSYAFRLVALRGTLNVNAVFGPLSNVASGTTAAGTVTPAPVASVSLSPTSSSLLVGGTQEFTATLKDASGNVLTGRSVTWTSSAPLVASVSGTGLASGLLAGLSTITATSEGISSSAALTVTADPQPPSGAVLFPNEPSGLSVIQESDWESGTVDPWYREFTSADKPITIVPIADSPLGESQTLQIFYPAGAPGGGGTELRYDIPATLAPTELFVGYEVQVSPNWQGHSSAINKMVYLSDGGPNFSAMWYEMFGADSEPLGLYVVNQSGSGPAGMHENVTPVTFARGQWHRVEIYQRQGSPGIVRVWVDGVLAIDRSDVYTQARPFDGVVISGIWGGIGDSKAHDDYMRFDHVRISGR